MRTQVGSKIVRTARKTQTWTRRIADRVPFLRLRMQTQPLQPIQSAFPHEIAGQQEQGRCSDQTNKTHHRPSAITTCAWITGISSLQGAEVQPRGPTAKTKLHLQHSTQCSSQRITPHALRRISGATRLHYRILAVESIKGY